jgi:steroid delta-isomerase-like uncharacterized protein
MTQHGITDELRQRFLTAWKAAWSDGDFSLIEPLLARDYVRRTLYNERYGVDELRRSVEVLHDAFPDIETTAEDVVVAGDRLALRWRSVGTHTADFLGVPATGKDVEAVGISITRFDDDLVAEEWVTYDSREVLRGLGVTPTHTDALPADVAAEPDVLRAFHRKFVTGVTIVTTSDGDMPRGLAVNAFASVSLEPALILVCVAHTSATYRVLFRADTFAVNVLSRNQLDVARTFAASGDASKFEGVAWHPGVTGSPVIEGASAFLEARTVERARASTHTVFIGHVLAAADSEEAPLVYAGGRFYDGSALVELDG